MTVLFQIERFLRDSAMPPTKFGRLAVNDPRIVGDLRRGRQPGPGMTTRIERFIAAHRA